MHYSPVSCIWQPLLDVWVMHVDYGTMDFSGDDFVRGAMLGLTADTGLATVLGFGRISHIFHVDVGLDFGVFLSRRMEKYAQSMLRFESFHALDPTWFVVQVPFLFRPCDCPHNGNLHLCLRSVSPLAGAKSVQSFFFTWRQRLSDLKCDHPRRSAGTFVTVIDHITTVPDITFHDHSTVERDSTGFTWSRSRQARTGYLNGTLRQLWKSTRRMF